MKVSIGQAINIELFQVHKLTLCQAEILHKRSRLGEPMSEEQIEEMKHKMTSLKPYHMPMPVKRFENGLPLPETSEEKTD